jgi:hypothetical protein
MAITWGSTALKITSYKRLGGDSYLEEHELVPDPTVASTTPQSILQGFGRNRIRISIDGYATDSEAATFDTDKRAVTTRTLTIDFDNSLVISAVIAKFDTWQQIAIDKTWYSMELIEV